MDTIWWILLLVGFDVEAKVCRGGFRGCFSSVARDMIEFWDMVQNMLVWPSMRMIRPVIQSHLPICPMPTIDLRAMYERISINGYQSSFVMQRFLILVLNWKR